MKASVKNHNDSSVNYSFKTLKKFSNKDFFPTRKYQ